MLLLSLILLYILIAQSNNMVLKAQESICDLGVLLFEGSTFLSFRQELSSQLVVRWTSLQKEVALHIQRDNEQETRQAFGPSIQGPGGET
jgi:hypothetical protein